MENASVFLPVPVEHELKNLLKIARFNGYDFCQDDLRTLRGLLAGDIAQARTPEATSASVYRRMDQLLRKRCNEMRGQCAAEQNAA